MRVLISGVIGAAVAAAAWLGLEHSLQRDLGWLAIGVGLVTGLCVHKAAGAATGGGYVRGALSVIIALAAIVGGRQIYAKAMEATSESLAGTAKPVMVDAPAEDATGESGEAEEGEDAEAPAPIEKPKVAEQLSGPAAKPKVAMKKRLSEMDFVWIGVAALAAYITGKGPDAKPVTEEQPEQPEQPVDEGESGEGGES